MDESLVVSDQVKTPTSWSSDGRFVLYDVAPDGRFLINTELDSAAAPITLIQHWRPDERN